MNTETNNNDQNNQEPTTPVKKGFFAEYASSLFTFFGVLILVIVVRLFFIDIAYVSGDSMSNTIHDNDRVLFSRVSTPITNDIVVVETDNESKLIKRVIGIAGDTVEIKKGVLYVNDKIVDEPYIKEPMNDYDFEKITVPENKIFVLGDNRNNSSDSRYYGVFDLDDHFVGKVFFDWESVFTIQGSVSISN